MNLIKTCFIYAICLYAAVLHPAQAQVISDQPVVFSQTMIAIVPGSVVPKTLNQSPELQSQPEAAQDENPTEEEKKDTEAPPPAAPEMKLRVQVRPDQIPLDSGIFHNYTLDDGHGVLTYFADSQPRPVVAENIRNPLDILFVGDDGIIGQIIPEVVPAYLSETIEVTFPLRALLYIQAGLAEKWGIQPGYRIEHGMFKPKPLIYTAPEKSE